MQQEPAGIRDLEERGFNAWPALQSVLLGGWVLRLSAGLTKRANSANALAPDLPFDALRKEVEALYARHDLPAIFRLTPLAEAEADDRLARTGYRRVDPSLVMTAPLAADPRQEANEPVLQVETRPGEDWLRDIAAARAIPAARRPAHDAMLRAIAPPAAFATLHEEGRPVGFGLAVIERGAVGLFDITVDPAARRRGHGRRLTLGLLAWGAGLGARQAYLQAAADNVVALQLYRSLGFTEAYRYHYRIRP